MLKPVQPQGVEVEMVACPKEPPLSEVVQSLMRPQEKKPGSRPRKTLTLTYVNDKGEKVTEEYQQIVEER